MRRLAPIVTCMLLMAMQAPTTPTPPSAAKEPLQLDEALLAPRPAAADAGRAADTPRDFDAAAFRAAVRRSESAMDAKDWSGAEAALQEALSLKPDSKEAAYNLGLAQYMQGKFQEAARRFEESAAGASSIKDARASADLAARSMYNEGRARYGELLDMLSRTPPGGATPGGQQPGLPPEQLKEAIRLAQNSLTHFKDAAIADPTDQDSAANAETSLQLLKQLRKLEQQQQQQQQNKNQEQKQDQQQKQDSSAKQDQKSESSKNEQQQQQQNKQDQKNEGQLQKQDQKDGSKDQKSESSKNEQQQQQQQQQQNKQQQQQNQSAQDERDQSKAKSSSNGDQDDPQPPEKPKQEPRNDQPKQQPKDGKPSDPKNDPGESPQPSEPQAAEGKPGDAKTQSTQQAKADKLLQLVRDKEKARNAERQAAKGQTRPTPAERDW